jgi:subfamily B ATP-binding cassette protein MsbA
VVLVRSASLFAQTVSTNRLALSVMRDLQAAMYKASLGADFGWLETRRGGELVSRFTNDVSVLRESLVRAANNLMRDSLQLVGAAGVMLYLDWVLALLVFIMVPLALPVVSGIGKSIRRRSDTAQAQMGDLTGFLQETFGAARVVKAFNMAETMYRRGVAAFERRFRLSLGVIQTRSTIEPFLEVIGGLALALVFAVAGYRAATGQTDVGDFLGFIVALLIASPALRALGSLTGAIQEGVAALNRVYDVIDSPYEEEDDERPSIPPLKIGIALKGVGYAYPDNSPALENVSFEVAAGSFTAIVGPSGSGKSTLFDLLLRLRDPESGRIMLDGASVDTFSRASVREQFALVSQDTVLFEDSVAVNIAAGDNDPDLERVQTSARLAHADDFISRLPDQYQSVLGTSGSGLSGGQRQRIALARALYQGRACILLDEATSALDAESEAAVVKALASLQGSVTIIMIAHRLNAIRNADQILQFDAGRLVQRSGQAIANSPLA